MEEAKSQTTFKELDKSARLQKIIDTAAQLFHIKGYKATTLDDVAKQLGITKAALYHYISSKEQLLYKIYLQALENIFSRISRISEMDISPDEKLRLIIENHIKDIIIDSISMIAVFFTEENQLPEENFRKIQQEKRKYNRIVEKVIEDGISQGIFKDVDPKLQANAIIGMCNWVYKWYKPGKTTYSPDQIASCFVNLLETGYLKKDHSEKHVNLEMSDQAVTKSKLKIAKETLQELKFQCQGLIKIIEEIEKSE